ncbi:MAG: hypothetical protein PCALPYG88_7008 [uncultured Paraburkholderia sp.]|nr:MAG: hypothetical protein PCALPYG08_7013 [uncultured Paraburkholderia sp.]CAH2941573.1 MAG: hypothetical protein PCALPYG88_7008 [uncultured Paraburkholderia sp.]
MSTAWTAQSQAIQLQDALEVSEEHFHFLSLPARLLVSAVVAMRLASSRAASWMLRVILRNDIFGQH